MRHAVNRLLAVLLGMAVLTACAPPPRPFEHDSSVATNRRLTRDKIELAIGAPRNMPPEMGKRVAAALAMELQAYGIIATVQPAEAPIQVVCPARFASAGSLTEATAAMGCSEVLASAPSTEDGQFRVPPVLGEAP